MKAFISYRKKSESGVLVNQLANRLREAKITSFLDRDGIGVGKYEPRILNALANADIVVVVVSETWLTVADAAGKRRLDDPEDWVRREIGLAQQLGKEMVLVLFDVPPDFVGRFASDTVPEVRGLSQYQAYHIAREYIDRDIDAFCRIVARTMRRKVAPDSRVALNLLAMTAVAFLFTMGVAFVNVWRPELPDYLPLVPGSMTVSAWLFWLCVKAGVIQQPAAGES